jgi:hypothetical protein
VILHMGQKYLRLRIAKSKLTNYNASILSASSAKLPYETMNSAACPTMIGVALVDLNRESAAASAGGVS